MTHIARANNSSSLSSYSKDNFEVSLVLELIHRRIKISSYMEQIQR